MSTQNNKTMLVRDVMLGLDRIPVVKEKTIFKEALEEMGRTRLGIVCIVNDNNQLLGILTDGDIRRKLLKVQKPFSAFFVDDALDHSIRSPVVVSPSDMLRNAIELMEKKQIWDLPVIENDTLVGLLHLHPAVQALLEG
jgi:DeoR family transcriptional regulator, catabolite repression regulator